MPYSVNAELKAAQISFSPDVCLKGPSDSDWWVEYIEHCNLREVITAISMEPLKLLF